MPLEPAADAAESVASRLWSARELAPLLAIAHEVDKTPREWQELLERIGISAEPEADLRSLGRARKVSVSLPEGLTAAVQQRVGKGQFSHYVAEAVSRQLELDLLAELAALLEAEHGPVPEEFLAEAETAWPDHE